MNLAAPSTATAYALLWKEASTLVGVVVALALAVAL